MIADVKSLARTNAFCCGTTNPGSVQHGYVAVNPPATSAQASGDADAMKGFCVR